MWQALIHQSLDAGGKNGWENFKAKGGDAKPGKKGGEQAEGGGGGDKGGAGGRGRQILPAPS